MSNKPIARLTGAEYVPIEKINIGQRLRRRTPEVIKHIEDLAESIKLNGPISPLLLDDDNNLVAGGCRIEAYKLLGETEVPCARRSKLSPAKLKMLEVEENLRRRRMLWHEVVLGIYEVHNDATEKASKLKESWGTRATGTLVKQSHSYVADAVLLAQYILKGDVEIIQCASMEKAKAVLLARKEAAVVQHRAATSATPIVVTPQPTSTRKSASGIISLTLGPPGVTPPPEPNAVLVSKEEMRELKQVNLSNMLYVGDCRDVMVTFAPDSIDIIVTDIPYGIDMANLEDIQGVEDVADDHDVEENIEQMEGFLKESFRVLRPNSFLLFFYALQHNEKLRAWGTEAGFTVCDWPILWLKPHSCKNNAPHANPTKSFEPVMVMRKGKANMLKPMTLCHKEVDGMPDKRLQMNPFAKPLEFMNWLLSHYVNPGMTLLDPYAGEGSILRAAILNGCKPIGIERNVRRFPRLVNRIKGIYNNTFGKGVTFIDPQV